MAGLSIFQDSGYATFLRMQALHMVLNMPGQHFTVFYIQASGSKYARANNMASL